MGDLVLRGGRPWGIDGPAASTGLRTFSCAKG
jgi:hypothetical protein